MGPLSITSRPSSVQEDDCSFGETDTPGETSCTHYRHRNWDLETGHFWGSRGGREGQGPLSGEDGYEFRRMTKQFERRGKD